MKLEYTIFPKGIEYPGHPTAIALVIMEKYASFAEAMHKKEGAQYPNALGDSDIPGAGGNVYSATDLLQVLVKEGPEAALEWGDQAWLRCTGPGTGNIEKSYEPGQQQVDDIKLRFLEKARQWDHSTQTEHAAEKLSENTPDIETRDRPRPRI